MKRILLLLTLLVVSTLALAACAPQQTNVNSQQPEVADQPIDLGAESEGDDTPQEETPQENTQELEAEIAWTDRELTDINGDSFRISDFAGQNVYVESFAVWCPNCKQQQETMETFHEVDADAITIAINTDANEDEALVREYVDENGFTSRYVVSSTEFTNTLIAEFGSGIVSAPSVPVIHVCPDGDAVLMDRGQKDIEELQQIQTRCA